jgi:hypothetical protein
MVSCSLFWALWYLAQLAVSNKREEVYCADGVFHVMILFIVMSSLASLFLADADALGQSDPFPVLVSSAAGALACYLGAANEDPRWRR